MTDISDIKIGDTINFTSKRIGDHNVYYGIVIGFVTEDVAKGLADIYAYNANAQAADANVPNVDLLSFMIIKLLEPGESDYSRDKYMIPFAKEWVVPSSLTIVETEHSTLIKVFEVGTHNAADLISYLRAGGYKARVDRIL